MLLAVTGQHYQAFLSSGASCFPYGCWFFFFPLSVLISSETMHSSGSMTPGPSGSLPVSVPTPSEGIPSVPLATIRDLIKEALAEESRSSHGDPGT